MASAPSGTSSPRDSPAPSTARQKSTPNGLRSRSKQTLGDSDNTPVSDLSSSDQHSHDRLLFLTACAVGSTATVTTISGDSFAGIFSGASLDKQGSKYVLKMVKKILSAKDQQPNGVVDPTEYVGYGGDHIMTFDPTDISYCTFSGLQLEKTLSRAANGSYNKLISFRATLLNRFRYHKQLSYRYGHLGQPCYAHTRAKALGSCIGFEC